MKSVDNDARSRKTAEQLKTKGNDCFHRGKLGAAIDYYTEAITLCPRWSTPIVNRALCHKNRGNWEGVIRDCERVLELDRENLKAHYFLGLAHISRGSYATAVAFLERALKLARDTESTIKEEVWRALARAKSENHGAIAASRAVRRQDLLRKIKAALKAETGKKMQRGEHKANNIIDAAEELERDTGLLEEIFHSDEIRYRGDDIPNWCTCQLTLDVFHEPVVTPCGISYEQNTLLEHLRKVGEFDPVTRRPLKEKDLRKNVGLRNAIECYLNDNPWAWEYCT